MIVLQLNISYTETKIHGRTAHHLLLLLLPHCANNRLSGHPLVSFISHINEIIIG